MPEIDWEEMMTKTRQHAELAAHRSERIAGAMSDLIRENQKHSKAVAQIEKQNRANDAPLSQIATELRQTNARLRRVEAAQRPDLLFFGIYFAVGLCVGLFAAW